MVDIGDYTYEEMWVDEKSIAGQVIKGISSAKPRDSLVIKEGVVVHARMIIIMKILTLETFNNFSCHHISLYLDTAASCF